MYGQVIVITLAALALFLFLTPAGRGLVERCGAFIPGMNDLVRLYYSSQLMRVIARLVKAGVAPSDAVELAVPVIRLSGRSTTGAHLQACIQQGRSFSEAAEEARLLSPLFARSIKHAEKGGSLGEALETIGEEYERRFETAQHGMVTILEPILIITVGAIIGTIIVSAYLPLFSLPNAIR